MLNSWQVSAACFGLLHLGGGEVLGVVGGSGAGKSVLLRHALGLLRSLAPDGAKRLFLLALDLLLGRTVLALQLEMLLDRIIE